MKGKLAAYQFILNPPGCFQGEPDAPWFRFRHRISNALAARGQALFPYRLMDARMT